MEQIRHLDDPPDLSQVTQFVRPNEVQSLHSWFSSPYPGTQDVHRPVTVLSQMLQFWNFKLQDMQMVRSSDGRNP